MKIVCNAGHTKFSKGTGAKGYLTESVETRKLAYEVMKLLADSNHEVVPAVFDRSTDNLKEAVTLANTEGADLFVSIHLNAGGGTGCEAYTWNGKKTKQAVGVCEELAKLGFKNRGVKKNNSLYVLKNTEMPALLIEVCFVDNKQDYELYKKLGVSKVAKAIFNGITR